MILPPDFEQRTLDVVRECTRDIVECAEAEISVVFHDGTPFVRFVFGDKRLRGRPTLTMGLVEPSSADLLAQGRLVEKSKLQKHIRIWVEKYLKLNGVTITRKVAEDAYL